MTHIKEICPVKRYDLEERTFIFAKKINGLISLLPRNLISIEISKQLIRSASSVGANYIEANEALSKKDFFYRVKLCRKEAKESTYWLRLLVIDNKLNQQRESLMRESIELMNIFGAIIKKSKE
jgi:four helix bundle protein